MISDIIVGIIIAFGVYFIVASIAAVLFIFGVFYDLEEKIHDRKKSRQQNKNGHNE